MKRINSLRDVCIPACVRLISLDIFDTLLTRMVAPPETIKRIAAEYAIRRLNLAVSPEGFVNLRKRVEQEHCSESVKRGGDGECCVADVYADMCREWEVDREVAERLLACELEIEKTYCIPLAGVEEVLKKLAATRRLVAISDTYLPLWMLIELLEKNGLACYFQRVYASCEYDVNKGSGRLFKKVIEQEGVTPEELLHIGDNFLGDYFSPRRLGIPAVLLDDRKNQRRQRNLVAVGKLEKTSSYWRGTAFAARLATIGDAAPDLPKEQYYRWGRLVVGPLLVNYVHLLCNELRNSDHEAVYFIAREGYLLKRLYELFATTLFDDGLPPSRYLCVSRYTSFLSALQEAGSREVSIALSEFVVTLDAVLARFGITDRHEIAPILRRHGWSDDSLLSRDDLADLLQALLGDDAFLKLVRERSSSMRHGLEYYLAAEGFFTAKNVALADVGWFGGIQDSLSRAFADRQDMPVLRGYYLALEGSELYASENKSGLVHDFRRPTPEGTALTFFKLALEFSCRAQHGSTIGYGATAEGRAIPFFKVDGREKRSDAAVAAIQRGVMDCALEYLKLVQVDDIAPDCLRDVLVPLYDWQISFPDQAMAKAFAAVINTEDFGSDTVKTVTGTFSLADILKPAHGLAKLIETPWREAALAQLHLPGILSAFYAAKRVLAWRKIGRGVM